MRTTFAFAFTSMLAATILAQNPDPLTQARARLQKALTANAAQPSGAFAARWGPAVNPAAPPQNAANVMVMLGGMGSSHQPGAATGTWTPELLCLCYDDNTELAFANRRMIAKDATEPWCLRREVTADGSPLPFVPDVPYLLQQLARQDIAVIHQEVGTRDDRPVEILTLALNADQVTDAMWGGLMPKPAAGLNGVAFRRVAAGGAPKPIVPKPEATVDIAIVLDPATAVVHAITVRSYQKEDPRLNRAFAAGGGAVVQIAGAAGGNDDSDEDEADAKADKNAPMQFQDGLPVRSRKKMTVWDYRIELKDLGTAKAPELPAEARALLGLQ